MKKFISKILMMIAIAISFSAVADAQFVVKIRPTAEIRVRPVAPSPRHVWVGGEWSWGSGRYNYTEGYWAEPQNGYRRRTEGHWRNTRRGYTWVPGSWRR
jgi:hypothetical protein